MGKIANIRIYNTFEIVNSLMEFSLHETRYTFYVNYFIIISVCNTSNLSIAKINSVKFTTGSQPIK